MGTPLAGRTAVVVGAAGEAGRRATRTLLERGAQVVSVDRDKRELRALNDDLPEGLPVPLMVPYDVTSDETALALGDTVAALSGEVDVLVHAAEASAAERVVLTFLPALRQSRVGRIIVVGDDAPAGAADHDGVRSTVVSAAGLTGALDAL